MSGKTTLTLPVDNFEWLGENLFRQPLDPGEFFFVQILLRPKDGHKVSGDNKHRMIRYYCVKSKERLAELRNEIMALCTLHNARAYVHPTPRFEKEVAGAMLKMAAEEYVLGNYHLFRRLHATACGQTFVRDKKKFVVDLDGETVWSDERIESILYHCRGVGGDKHNKIEYRVRTKSGIHLITCPFDVGQFEKEWKNDKVLSKYPVPDIHKNNPTLLYCPAGFTFDATCGYCRHWQRNKYSDLAFGHCEANTIAGKSRVSLVYDYPACGEFEADPQRCDEISSGGNQAPNGNTEGET